MGRNGTMKPFICEYCDKRFAKHKYNDLVKHKKTHLVKKQTTTTTTTTTSTDSDTDSDCGDFIYECGDCGANFSSPSCEIVQTSFEESSSAVKKKLLG